MDIVLIYVKQGLHSHLSEYFSAFKINTVDICKNMLRLLPFLACDCIICKNVLSKLTATFFYMLCVLNIPVI